jgi:hypothetical protein
MNLTPTFHCRGAARCAQCQFPPLRWARHAVPLHLILMAATIPAQPPEDQLITELRTALSASASQELQFAVAESDRAVVFALDTATMTPDRAWVFAYEAVEHDGVTHFERLDARPELPGVQPFEISLREGAGDEGTIARQAREALSIDSIPPRAQRGDDRFHQVHHSSPVERMIHPAVTVLASQERAPAGSLSPR